MRHTHDAFKTYEADFITSEDGNIVTTIIRNKYTGKEEKVVDILDELSMKQQAALMVYEKMILLHYGIGADEMYDEEEIENHEATKSVD